MVTRATRSDTTRQRRRGDGMSRRLDAWSVGGGFFGGRRGAVVGEFEVLDDARAVRDDGVVVERRVRGEVVGLDVGHVDDLGAAEELVDVAAVLVDRGVLGDLLFVRLEVHDVDLVEAHERHEEPDVGEREGVAAEIPLLGEDRLDLVERLVEVGDRLVVRQLRLREPRAVDAVVNPRVDPRVELLLERPRRRRIEIEVGVLGELVEGLVEHDDELGRLVVDDGARFFVPQQRHRELGRGRARRGVDVAHRLDRGDVVEPEILGEPDAVVEVERAVARRRRQRRLADLERPPGVLVFGVVGPRALPRRRDDREPDGLLEALELADRRDAVRPRTRPRDDEVVPPRLGLERRVLLGDPLAKRRRRAHEPALLVALLERRLRARHDR
mmetsp:Transcript_876/g.3476  ORF Transcript_876/g.3476 Transcript_876/m.3476 type:complete len:385 (+) Transcript_876:928-2082(+)